MAEPWKEGDTVYIQTFDDGSAYVFGFDVVRVLKDGSAVVADGEGEWTHRSRQDVERYFCRTFDDAWTRAIDKAHDKLRLATENYDKLIQGYKARNDG